MERRCETERWCACRVVALTLLQMRFPGYLLNPGDMFQVEVDRVLYATGAPKDAQERRAGRVTKSRMKKQNAATEGVDAAEAAGEPAPAAVEQATPEVDVTDPEAVAAKRKQHKVNLKDILERAKGSITKGKDELGAKRKQDIRAFAAMVRQAMGKVNKTDVKTIDEELNTLLEKLAVTTSSPQSDKAARKEANAEDASGGLISQEDKMDLLAAMRAARDNPIDNSKAYATPWRPRPYMSPFAFIPRYLEVNQNICSAVYLRHPVARPQLAEVPTPFSKETSQLAFTWYLRRR